MTPLPTDIAAIAKIEDGALRNLLITQRYFDLSKALVETIGPADVNWSTFATWASKTAGLSIRNEEVPAFVVELSGARAVLIEPVRQTLGTVSKSIADGNKRVYEELAPLFATFVRIFRDSNGDRADLTAFTGTLDPRESKDGGQAPLISAFTSYFEARRADDPMTKAKLMLLGNCLIGLHEQTRLQPQIQEAMDAPIDVVVRDFVQLGTRKGLIGRLVSAVEASFFELPLEEAVKLAEVVWEEVATRLLMSLALPGGAVLPLGRNIPRSHAARSYLPASLREIIDPETLVKLLGQYDRARGDTDVGSASVDWRVLEDRMNFIVNLFRSRQQDAELLDPPFTLAQRAAFESGKMPDRSLGKL